MSQYVLTEDPIRIKFGWDKALQSFYLQVHDVSIENEEEQIIKHMGAGPDDRQLGVALIVQEARKHGFDLGRSAYEAIEEMYGMIWFLAYSEDSCVDPAAAVEAAHQNYTRGLELAKNTSNKRVH
jgi:hypothetical protein